MAPQTTQKRRSLHRVAWYFGIPVTFLVTLLAVGGGLPTDWSTGGEARAASAIGDFLADPLLLITMIPIWTAGGYSWAWFVVRALNNRRRTRVA